MKLTHSLFRKLCIFGMLYFCLHLQLISQTPPPQGSPLGKFVSVKEVKPEALAPNFSRILTASSNLWTFNAVDSYDPEWKTEVFYVTSFVIGGNPPGTGQLIKLDYRRNRAEAWTIPTGIGSWGIIQARDGNLYMGSYNEGKLMGFNPRTKTWIDVPQASPEFRKQNFIITDLVEAPDGNIYYGTFPAAHLVRYNPREQTVTDLGQVADEKYLRWLAVTPKGIVLCGVGPRHARVIAYDPQTKAFRTITPENDQTAGAFSRPLASSRYVVEGQHSPGGKVLVYDPTTLKLLHRYTVPLRNNGSGNQSIFTLADKDNVLFQEDDQTLKKLNLGSGARTTVFKSPGTAANNRWYFDKSGNLLGLLVQSYVYLDRAKAQVTHEPIPLSHPAQNILWLNTSPDGTIYGGPPFGQNLFSFQPKTNLLTSYDQVIDRTGEIYYGIPYKDKVYTMSYAEAGLAVFDPHKAWNPGEKAASNPRAIVYFDQLQYRPVGGIHLGPGNKMYIGTQPDYGLVGGALSVFDPETEKLEIYRNLIPDEEIAAIATDDRYVYGEADSEGGGGSKPVAEGVHFFVWDPQSRKLVFDQILPGAGSFRSIAAVRGHAYFVTGGQMMDYDSTTRVLSPVPHLDGLGAVPPESLKAAKDGTLFGIFGKQLGRFDPKTRHLQLFPETAGYATSGLTLGTDGTVYFGSYTDMGIYHPESPSPLASYGN